MKNAEKMTGNWREINAAIQKRWNTISDNDLTQASGIPELATFISNKVGEPRENVLHELINLIQNADSGHPMLKDYFNNTMASGDDGSNLRPTGENESRL